MPDREKVIKALEYCVNAYPNCGEKCPYIHLCFNNGRQIQRDAFELLKKQEPVKPILKREGRNKLYNDYVCPNCDNNIVYEQNYCSECGKPITWEGW